MRNLAFSQKLTNSLTSQLVGIFFKTGINAEVEMIHIRAQMENKNTLRIH